MHKIEPSYGTMIAFGEQELEDIVDAVCFRYKALRDKNMKDIPSYIRVELERERESLSASFKSLGKILKLSDERIQYCLDRGAIRA